MIVLMTLEFVLVERDFIFSSFSRTIKSAKFRIIPKMNIDIKIKDIGVIKKKVIKITKPSILFSITTLLWLKLCIDGEKYDLSI